MSEPLLGVILATASSRGSHIVFRWPNNPKLLKRYSKVKYYTESRPSHLNRTHLDDDLDPMRQKAKWDQHDEDEDDQADAHSDGAGQSDTPSSSDVEDSDGTMADEDENRSVRDRAETIASHGRSKAGAVPSTTRSKSKPRRPLAGLEECNQSVRSTDRPTGAHKDVSDAHEKAPESDTGTSKELSPEEKARREERAARAYKSYLGYDIDVLASILNPRPELAHQKFELVVDDLAFLGHPVSASKAGTWGETEDERNNNDEYLDDGNERPSRQTQQRGRSGLRKEICPCDVQDGDNPPQDGEDSTAKSAKLEPNPSAKSRSLSRTRTEESTESSTSRSLVPLTQFHLVLVLDRPDPSDALSGMDLSSWLQLFYDNIVFKMTAALFAEQSKTDYVGRETEKLLALRERCMDDGQAYAAYAAQCLGISSLARCIRDLHKSISTSSDAFLTINDRIEVHLQLPPILQEPDNLPKIVDIETELDPKDSIFMSGGGFAGLGKEGADEDGGGGTYDRLLDLAPHELSFEEWCRTTGPYLLPWKTLLLLYDQAEEVPRRGRQTPGNSSPGGMASPDGGQATDAYGFEQLTRNFTSLFRPNLYHSLNFREVADMLGWNLYEDVYPMIRHLIYYRQARVIDIPHIGHVYAISPLFDFARLGPLSHIWAQTFPDVAPLPVLLSQLSSSSRALSALFPARHQRELALDVLIWLLRREVVVKMHIRLRLIATESVKRRTAERRMERHERHRARKEKKRERAAKAEARRMKKSQSEEQQRRKAAEQAKRKKEKEEQRKAGLQEERGRSRDRERSRSADTRQQGEEAAKEGAADDCDICTADDGGEGGIQTSGLSVSRPPILAHPDSVAEAAAAAAVISGSGEVAEERRTGSRERGHHHRHHHGHHHHHHHHRHHKHQQHVNDSVGGTDSSTAATDKGPIPIATRPRFDDLKFERRPVLRSRSPSTATMVTPANPGLSVSFGNVGERSELVRRARADTTGSSSSGGGLTHAQIRSDGLSITSATSQHSRPTTPNKFGRNIPSHVRDRSIGGSGSNISSSAEGSLPRRTRRATSSAGWGGRKGVARSRSPSRARMRVKGFGVDAEVEIDEDKSNEEDDEAEIKEESELASKFNSLQLEEKKGMTKRRISAASERPDLPPPSENGGSDNEKRSSQRCCSAHSSSSPFSSSSSGEISSSDLSLSSDLSESESHLHSSALSSDVGHSRPALHRSNTPATAEGDDFSASLIVEPARASRRENDYISTMVVGKDPTTVKNFYRLLPYLNGKHSIDEIEYRVNMPRRDIRRLLNLFKDFIITFLHP